MEESRDIISILSLDAMQGFNRIERDLLQHEPNPSYFSHAKHPLKLARVQLRTYYIPDSLLRLPVTVLLRSTAQSFCDQNGSFWEGTGVSYRLACFNHKAGTEASLKKTKSHSGLVTRSTVLKKSISMLETLIAQAALKHI